MIWYFQKVSNLHNLVREVELLPNFWSRRDNTWDIHFSHLEMNSHFPSFRLWCLRFLPKTLIELWPMNRGIGVSEIEWQTLTTISLKISEFLFSFTSSFVFGCKRLLLRGPGTMVIFNGFLGTLLNLVRWKKKKIFKSLHTKSCV